jgi:hypothetical protein
VARLIARLVASASISTVPWRRKNRQAPRTTSRSLITRRGWILVTMASLLGGRCWGWAANIFAL